jgi:hypothetical protein
MVHYWHVVKNVLKWKLGYTAYLGSIKNGRASVAVAVEGEVEACRSISAMSSKIYHWKVH